MRIKATHHANQSNATLDYVADTRLNLAQAIWSDTRGKEVMAYTTSASLSLTCNSRTWRASAA